jgi:hypothetical protein
MNGRLADESVQNFSLVMRNRSAWAPPKCRIEVASSLSFSTMPLMSFWQRHSRKDRPIEPEDVFRRGHL